MKGEYVYTILFTFIVSAFFTALLAITNAAYSPRIQENQEHSLKQAVLYSINADLQTAAVSEVFETSIDLRDLSGVEVFVKLNNHGDIESYAIPLLGAGVWGTIRGYLGVSVDLSEVLGIEFTEQNETPGLGGRIEEAAFKEQFRGISLSSGEKITYQDDLDAITGATGSSNAVIRIINDTLQTVLPRLEVVQ